MSDQNTPLPTAGNDAAPEMNEQQMHALFAQRLAKAKELEAAGIDPWGQAFPGTEMIEKVRAAGRPVTMEPSDKALGPDYPIRVAFCTGPAGEEIEFFQTP